MQLPVTPGNLIGSMRNLLRLPIALLFVGACLTACSGDNTPNLAPLKNERATSAASRQIAARVGDLDSMAEHRVIRILSVYSIGRYYLDAGEERGLVKESAVLFEDFINDYLKRGQQRISVAVIPVARDELIPALLAGRGDIIQAGLSITPERRAKIAFSIPASKPLSEIIVTGPSAPPLQTLDDLSGQTVYLRQSSSYRESVDRLNERLKSEGKQPVNIQPVSELFEDSDLVEMVNAGMLPWTIVDDYKLPWWQDAFEDLVIRDDLVVREHVHTAWGMRKDSPQLMAAVNEYLKTHREGTRLGNVLQNRYFRDFDWATNALAADVHERFLRLEPLFRRYGERYAIEHLLLAAQAYQESRLDQSARSAAGAVGVMQIKPSTASDPNVNVSNIHQVESNIHAGAKYLDFLRGRYFNDPEIDELNRVLMALAAYNIGPARMIGLRDRAQQLGYDPNVWFDNVELAAAQQVGREPVTYVANIYKYYIAYRLSGELVRARKAARERAGID
tara:strand:+ start:123 stop:1640 length:1518 start_codon:yes stop_codon:yes gene_type:complete